MAKSVRLFSTTVLALLLLSLEVGVRASSDSEARRTPNESAELRDGHAGSAGDVVLNTAGIPDGSGAAAMPLPADRVRSGAGAAPPSLRTKGLLPDSDPTPNQSAAISWRWAQTSTPTAPPARSRHAMVYDQARGNTVLFGGRNAAGAALGDTWVWDGASWTQKFPMHQPPPRYFHAMAWDYRNQYLVLFGGSTGSRVLNDTWIWDGYDWIQKSPYSGPPARQAHAMAYDGLMGVKGVALYSGVNQELTTYFDDTWYWDGLAWTNRTVTSARYPARSNVTAALTPSMHASAIGGWSPAGLVDGHWILAGGTWSKWTAGAPTNRDDSAACRDDDRGVTVLYGGQGSSVLSDTWAFDGSYWSQLAPAGSPGARRYHAMTYDRQRRVTVLFGGLSGSGATLGDTWTLGEGGGTSGADLVVQQITVTDANYAPVAQPLATGQTVRFSFRIANAGSASTTASVLHVSTYVDGVLFESGDVRLGSGPMPPGYGLNVRTEMSWVATAGTHRLDVVIDDTNLQPESNESNNSGSLQISVAGSTGYADLVVENITLLDVNKQPLGSAQAGQSVHFSARIANRGTGPTTAGSVHVTAYRDGVAYDSGTIAISLAPGAYQPVVTEVAWQVPAGSRTFRLDVDDTNVQPESNEGNNSGTYTFSVGGGVQVTSFTASPTTITAGQSTTLSWSSTGATSATIDNGVGAVATSGSRAVSPAQSTTYTLTVTGAGGAATRAVTVTVNPAAPTISSFTASPTTITKGQSTTLSWASTGGTSATIDNGVGAVATSGTRTVSPAQTTTYTLVVTGIGGSTNRNVTVTVSSGGGTPTINSFTVTPPTVSRGERATLSWSTSGGGVVTIDNGVGTVPASGTRVVTPSATTSYRLTASPAMTASEDAAWRASSPVSRVAVVAVGPPRPIDFSAFRVTLVEGEQRYVGRDFSVRVETLDASGQIVPFEGTVVLSANVGRLEPSWLHVTGGSTLGTVKILDAACNQRVKASTSLLGKTVSGESASFGLLLSDKVATVSGIVWERRGATSIGAEGATVTLTGMCGQQSVSTTTGSGGFYDLFAIPGEYRLTASKGGLTDGPVKLSFGEGSRIVDALHLTHPCSTGDRTPVLLLPGIMGSSTDNAGLVRLPTLPAEEVAWDDSRWGGDAPGTNRFHGLYDHALSNGGWEDLAEDLVGSGYQMGCTIFPVPYDWRLEPPEIAAKFLIPRIDQARKVSGAQKVQIVAHSMGGLVARSYLQGLARDELGRDFQARNDVERLAMIGTPNAGAPRAYLLWEGGDAALADDGETIEVYGPVLQYHYSIMKGTGSNESISRSTWRDFVWESVRSIGWLQPFALPGSSGPIGCLPSLAKGRLPEVDSLPVPTKIFAGARERTMTRIETDPAEDCGSPVVGLFPDGRPRTFVFPAGVRRVLPWSRPAEGDGTVPAQNTKLGSIDWTDSKSSSHVGLVNVYRPEILEFLGVSSANVNSNTRQLKSEAQEEKIILSVTRSASMSVRTPNGKTWGVEPSTGRLLFAPPAAVLATPEGGQVLTLTDPTPGTYRVQLTAGTEGLVSVASRLEGERPVQISGDLFVDRGIRSIDLHVDPTRPESVSFEVPDGPSGVRPVPYSSGSGEVVQLLWTAPKGAAPVSYRVVSRLASSSSWTVVGTTSATLFTTPHEWASSSSTPVRYYAVSAVFPGGAESFLSKTVKNDDRDGDGISDEEETEMGTNRSSRDSDGDGLSDMEELEHGSAPLSVDSDGDGASDLVEARTGTDPLSGASKPVFGSAVAQKLIPVVLDIDTGSVHYTTEVVTTNRGTTAAAVSYAFTPAAGFGGRTGTAFEALRPGEQQVIPDMVAYLRGRGLDLGSVGAGTSIVGTVKVTVEKLSAADGAAIVARTTAASVAPHPEGAAGLAYTGIDLGSASSTALTVFALRQDSTDRSNLAVVNTSGSAVSVRVAAFSGAGDGRSQVVRSAEALPAWGWVQLNRVFEGTGISKGWVTVERVSGTGTFSAYGVINDGLTNDGSFVLPSSGASGGTRMTVPVLVETSSFRSELVLANRSSSSAALTLRYVESGAPSLGSGGTTTVTLRPKEQLIIPDAIDWLRNKGLSIGSRGAGSFVGTLRIAVSGAVLADVYAGARTGSPSPAGGQFGLFTPGVYEGREAIQEAFVYGLRSDGANRSNVALLNSGPEGSGSVNLELRTFDGDPGGVERGSPQVVSLAPGQFRQYNNVLAGAGIRNGWVRVRRLSGSAPWVAYGVVNDGANPGERTGDGAYVPMVATGVNGG